MIITRLRCQADSSIHSIYPWAQPIDWFRNRMPPVRPRRLSDACCNAFLSATTTIIIITRYNHDCSIKLTHQSIPPIPKPNPSRASSCRLRSAVRKFPDRQPECLRVFLGNLCAHLVRENGRKIKIPTAYANTRKKTLTIITHVRKLSVFEEKTTKWFSL